MTGNFLLGISELSSGEEQTTDSCVEEVSQQILTKHPLYLDNAIAPSLPSLKQNKTIFFWPPYTYPKLVLQIHDNWFLTEYYLNLSVPIYLAILNPQLVL